MQKYQSIDDYRLTNLDEPPEEFLRQIMCEAAEDARIKGEKAMKKFFDEISEQIKDDSNT